MLFNSKKFLLLLGNILPKSVVYRSCIDPNSAIRNLEEVQQDHLTAMSSLKPPALVHWCASRSLSPRPLLKTLARSDHASLLGGCLLNFHSWNRLFLFCSSSPIIIKLMFGVIVSQAPSMLPMIISQPGMSMQVGDTRPEPNVESNSTSASGRSIRVPFNRRTVLTAPASLQSVTSERLTTVILQPLSCKTITACRSSSPPDFAVRRSFPVGVLPFGDWRRLAPSAFVRSFHPRQSLHPVNEHDT